MSEMQAGYRVHRGQSYVPHGTGPDDCWCGAELISERPLGTFRFLVAERASPQAAASAVVHYLEEIVDLEAQG